MRYRCTSPKHPAYASYGGRGIKVCDRWEKFENFLADMGCKPTAAHTLDRIDNDRGYELSNCRWATRVEQARNRRDCRATWDIVDEIRGRHEHGESGKSLERRFRGLMSEWNVSSIIKGVSWDESTRPGRKA